MNSKPRLVLICLMVAVLGFAILLAAGCQSKSDGNQDNVTDNSWTKNKRPMTKGGAQLWADNCTRCHNFRSPSEFSDAQWDVIVHHMKVRANLTAEEHEKIAEFLKAGN